MDNCICRDYDGSGIDQHGNRSCPVHNQFNTPLPHRDMGKSFTHIEDTFDNSVLSTICGCRHDTVTTATSSSHEHTEACQNATEVKRQLLTDLMEHKQLLQETWQTSGAKNDRVYAVPTPVIQNLLGGEK